MRTPRPTGRQLLALLAVAGAALLVAQIGKSPAAASPDAGVAEGRADAPVMAPASTRGTSSRLAAAVTPVTDAMLAAPPPADWLMWRASLNAWGFSPLDQIDAGNVGRLSLVWTRDLEPGPQEGTPLVHDGVLYFPNPGDVIQAIDAATGTLLWEHRRPSPPDIADYINQPFINRNLAIHGHLIIDTTADGALFALDARTGRQVWSTQVLDYRRGIHQTSGPIVADGKVFSGRGCEPLPTSGPEDCVITAHDAATGRELWRRRTIPGPGEAGDESWGDVPYAERRHVGTWMPPSYDPQLKLLYIGTSVTSPAPKFLLGGNDQQHLYHNSTLALDPESGRIVWHYQHLVDHWDMDHPFERILVDTAVTPSADEVAWINPAIQPGEVRPVITGIPGKTGIVYTLDRRTGLFLWARPTVHQTVVESIDGITGNVKVAPAALFAKQGDRAIVCPNANGGKNWPAGAYSPLTEVMYFPLQNTCADVEVTIASRKERSAYGIRPSGSRPAPGTDKVGSIHAISTVTGRTLWKFEQRAATLSLLTTGGGLLFGGDVAGRFRAFDQQSGKVLWEADLGSQVTGFPVSFAVQGRQYIAVSTGQAVSTGAALALTPEIRSGRDNRLYVFALGDGTRRVTSSGAAADAVANVTLPASCRRRDADEHGDGAPFADASFTAEQAATGRRLYTEQQCQICHGANLQGTPGAPALADEGFRRAWRGRTAAELLDCTRQTMPPGRTGSLSEAQHRALVAMILEANDVAGQ